ncbi:TonB-dependent receptor [Paucibacter sp. APW11]|uniref:TonB-dependent receptor n=1 Tax=Roseateles aquae TaxID=3077235 RepID=A0ABU3PEF5_9BURK|nr:TonB-dependent receptor [Paucibacter sp. APW11]MDT9000963.1 TonB-dependent receptor [Paucibacter sp. APW11]
MTRARTPNPTLLARAICLALALPALQAQAQDAASKLERVEITGSSIKRLAGEQALPVQTIQRDEIAKAGVTTAAELLKNISAAAANLGDGASITDNTGGQRGFNGANLRGVGVSSTLVLLNGRRLANFASPGDAAGVDLNSIPAGAIQRVEVLKDGASAIYGTDAIGGVINFITRQDYRGIDLSAYASATQEGGAGKRAFTLSAGHGDLQRDGFNVFATLDVQSLDALRSTQREFIQERPLAETVPFYLSSRPYPGNIRLSGTASTRAEQLAAINAAGYLFNGKPYTQRTLNLFAPTCNAPASVYAPTRTGLEACGYDYMADTEIYPKSDKLAFLTRGVLQLHPGHQLFGELLLARADTRYVLSPNPTGLTGLNWASVNAFLPKPVDNARSIEIRFRATELGNRSNEVRSDANRVVLGMKGSLWGDWDYSTALSHAQNKVADRYVDGYFKFNELLDAVRAGKINPFGPSPASSRGLIESLRIDDVARASEGTTTGLDFKISGSLGQLDGGEIGGALGAELRRETQRFTPSALLLSNNIGGDRDSSGTSPAIAATHYSRNIASVYAEVSAPLSKQLELQAALRADHYQQVGSSVNPKLGLRYQPSQALVLRASAGTGFRAPSFSELYRPTTYGSSPAFLYDKVYGDFDQYPTEKIANANLKPEKSRQLSLGLAFEPNKHSLVSLDYWQIRKTDVISDLSGKVILENTDRYGAYIKRDADDYPTLVLKKENQGGLKTDGLDLEARWRSEASGMGRIALNLSGTYVMHYQRQFGASEPYVENAGRFLQDQVIQRWRHRIAADWERGALTLTLANSYFSAYTDDSYLPDTEPRQVKAYSLWDLSASYRVNERLSVRGGVQNLLNTAPPYSNQSYYFLSTFDPTYTDPRGRNYFLSLNYQLR